MEMKRLLIADAGEEFRVALQESLQESYVIRTCREGHEALQMMESFRPDVLILDLLLPGIDGVTLLQTAQKRGFQPTVLATTRFISDYMMDAMARLEVGYVIMKPCEIDAVAARLFDLTRESEIQEVTEPDLQTQVDNVLRELRFQTHSRGYQCLRVALLEELRNPGQQVTKTLYPAVGKICGGNADQVERAIGRAIKQAWLCGEEALWREVFAAVPDIDEKHPSNKVFISAITSHILSKNKNINPKLRKIG